MIGRRVRVHLNHAYPEQTTVTGTLHKLDQAGATIWRECSLPEKEGISFFPAHRILEIEDIGRAG